MNKAPRVKDMLNQLDVRPSRHRGQNFLINDGVIESIVTFASPKIDEKIVEIGPGLGALTGKLIRFGQPTVIEIEERFCEELASQFPGIEIINEDVRFVDFSTIGKNLLIFGNLPYSFSTDIVFHLLSFPNVITRAILLLQREFAERMAASPGGKEYGVLSVSCQLASDLRLGPIIGGGNFHPRTEVDSRLVELVFRPDKFGLTRDEIFWLKRVVKAAFMRRRKKLHNSLRMAGLFSSDKIDEALKIANVDGNRRAETLEIREFMALARALKLEESV